MKKLMLIICLFLISLSGFGQLQQQIDTIVSSYVIDTVYTYNGYARGSFYCEMDFRAVEDKLDATIGFGGTWTPYDTSYAEYQSWNNPITLDLTNFPDTICRVERLSGLSAPYLKIKVTRGTVPGGTELPIKISFDRF